MILDFLTIFVTDFLLVNPVLSKSTWFNKCKWHIAWVMVAILRESSWSYCYPAIHKTAKTKKAKCKIMPKSESRILKKAVGFFSLGK